MTFYSLLLFFGIRWFFAPKATFKDNLAQMQLDLPGQEFRAPVSKLESMLLQREVDFDDKENVYDPETVVLYTKKCDYTFSTHGAVLSTVEFKKHKNEFGLPVRIVYPQNIGTKNGGTFLLAFEEQTPMNYFVDSQGQDEAGRSWVVFKTENDLAKIFKTYTVNDENHILELRLTIQPKRALLRPRVIFAGPNVSSLTDEKNTAVALDLDGKTLVQVDREKEKNIGWKLPQIFGIEDLYFLNALIGVDQNNFVQRAFLKRNSEQELLCFVEGREISEATDVTLKFYVGTKSLETLRAADELLVGLLNFGFLSLLCEWMIKILEYLAAALGNYGFAIILLALFYRFLLSPLTFFVRRRFKDALDFDAEYSHEINAINKEFKDDWTKKTEALDKFYRKHGRSSMQKSINLLPMLFVAPMVIASYKIFSSYINFYNAPFVFWIKDLSSRDPFMVLPILFGASVFLKEFLSGESSKKDFEWFKLLMPVFLILVFRNWSAGLLLFMVSDSIFTSLETVLYDLILKKRV